MSPLWGFSAASVSVHPPAGRLGRLPSAAVRKEVSCWIPAATVVYNDLSVWYFQIYDDLMVTFNWSDWITKTASCIWAGKIFLKLSSQLANVHSSLIMLLFDNSSVWCKTPLAMADIFVYLLHPFSPDCKKTKAWVYNALTHATRMAGSERCGPNKSCTPEKTCKHNEHWEK